MTHVTVSDLSDCPSPMEGLGMAVALLGNTSEQRGARWALPEGLLVEFSFEMLRFL